MNNISDVLGPIAALSGLALVWLLPVLLGLRAAARQSRSPHWMWFGVHPVGAWIACIALSCAPPLKTCPECTERVKRHARLCAYCCYAFPAEMPAMRSVASAAPGEPLATSGLDHAA